MEASCFAAREQPQQLAALHHASAQQVLAEAQIYRHGSGRLAQQLSCPLGCLHPILECRGSNPSYFASSPRFLLMHTLEEQVMVQVLRSLPLMSETHMAFPAPGFHLAQLCCCRHLGNE